MASLRQTTPNLSTLDEQIEFEQILSSLSSRFINLPPEQIDREIQNFQRIVCQFLDIDLSSLWQHGPAAPNELFLTHLYRHYGGPPLPDRMDGTTHFPWAQQQMLKGQTIVVPTVDELPPEAATDQQTFRHFEIRSAITFPLLVGENKPLGALSFNMTRTQRVWKDREIQRLHIVADIFANAINRKNADLAIKESNARLSMATESAGAGAWSLDLSTHRFWLTDEARRLFAFAPDVEISLQDVFDRVHPDDLPLVQQALHKAIRSETMLRVDYRMKPSNGKVQWMTSIGQFRPGNGNGFSDTIMGLTIDSTKEKQDETKLREALNEVERLRVRLECENSFLQQRVLEATRATRIIGESECMRRLLGLVLRVAPTDSAVLILGETGTGKELIAQAIHNQSSRSKRPMIKVNCAALPSALIESELFGRDKGAYTGAMTRQRGRFELAHGSTLFLDEIGDLPLELQAKLLRVLETGEFERLGGSETIHVDVRIISATNRNLPELVAKGSFRGDLYHRLNVFPIIAPPLRERTSDIPLLAWAFVHEFNQKMGRSVEKIPAEEMDKLKAAPWTGNVRELKNVIERAMILCEGKCVRFECESTSVSKASSPVTLLDLEREHILAILRQTRGRVSGPSGAAALLGLKPTTLHSRMKKLGIHRDIDPR